MKNRIKEIISDEGLNAAQFATEIGIAPSSLHHILSGRNNPSLDVIQKILARFPQINAEWLINSKGKKYKTLVQGELFDIKSELVDNNIDKEGNEFKIAVNENIEIDNSKQFTSKKQKTNKNIESIVIFYDDGSFKQYLKSPKND